MHHDGPRSHPPAAVRRRGWRVTGPGPVRRRRRRVTTGLNRALVEPHGANQRVALLPRLDAPVARVDAKHVHRATGGIRTRDLADPASEEHHPERHRPSLDRARPSRVPPRVPRRQRVEPFLRRSLNLVARVFTPNFVVRVRLGPEVGAVPERRVADEVHREHPHGARRGLGACSLKLREDGGVARVLRGVGEPQSLQSSPAVSSGCRRRRGRRRGFRPPDPLGSRRASVGCPRP
mmetsp:Transcript_7648/g.31006  ORF Transcript_7648/g.31006 Transcript_7648/m.31006 type:complete len:235 (+) Transcript_7648:1717-2421(+)